MTFCPAKTNCWSVPMRMQVIEVRNPPHGRIYLFTNSLTLLLFVTPKYNLKITKGPYLEKNTPPASIHKTDFGPVVMKL